MIARLVLLFAIPVLALGQDTDPKEAWAKEYNNDDRWNDTEMIGIIYQSINVVSEN